MLAFAQYVYQVSEKASDIFFEVLSFLVLGLKTTVRPVSLVEISQRQIYECDIECGIILGKILHNQNKSNSISVIYILLYLAFSLCLKQSVHRTSEGPESFIYFSIVYLYSQENHGLSNPTSFLVYYRG